MVLKWKCPVCDEIYHSSMGFRQHMFLRHQIFLSRHSHEDLNYLVDNFNEPPSEEEDEELVDLETFNRHLWANFPYRVRDPESGELYLPLPVYVDPEPENESETNANDTAHEAGTSREDSQPTDNVTAANNQSEEHNDSAEASKQ